MYFSRIVHKIYILKCNLKKNNNMSLSVFFLNFCQICLKRKNINVLLFIESMVMIIYNHRGYNIMYKYTSTITS